MQVDLLKAGDTTSAQALSASSAILAQHLMTGEGSLCLINQLVGAVVERNLLSKLPPESQPDFLTGTVQQRIDQLAAFRKSTIPLVQLSDDMFSRGNEAEIAGFFDRLKLQGEYQALLWLQRKDQYRSDWRSKGTPRGFTACRLDIGPPTRAPKTESSDPHISR